MGDGLIAVFAWLRVTGILIAELLELILKYTDVVVVQVTLWFGPALYVARAGRRLSQPHRVW